MKKIIYIIFLFANFIIAQQKNNIAVYSMKFNGVRPEGNWNEMREKIFKGKEAINDLELKLQFNDSLCKTNLTQNYNELNDVQRIGALYISCSKPSFISFKNKKSYTLIDKKYTESKGISLLYQDLDTIWNISNETKIIQNFTCIKATQQKTYGNGKKYTSTAWFCPELPFSFGPLEHIGLPGLILELNSKEVLFGLKTLELNKNTEEIVIPMAEKLLSEKEYFEIMDKTFNGMLDKK